jgi:hypothetical protein
MKNAIRNLVFGIGMAVAGTVANATTVMTYNGFGLAGGQTYSGAHVENGISMAPDVSGGHYDIYGDIVGGTQADNVAAIHHGNNGERVIFSFGGDLFDLQSIDITGWLIRLTGSMTVTFQGSNGTTHVITDGPTGTINFSSLVGWNSLSWFTIGTTEQVSSCSGCSIMGFDNVTIAAVPIPASLTLLGAGLVGLGLFGRRRRLRIA